MCSVYPKKRETRDEHVHACMHVRHVRRDVNVSFTIDETKRNGKGKTLNLIQSSSPFETNAANSIGRINRSAIDMTRDFETCTFVQCEFLGTASNYGATARCIFACRK